MKTILLPIIALFSILLLAGFVDDSEFSALPNIKSVTEWKEWADTSQFHESKKWLKSRREYYPNGELQQELYVEYNGDTTAWRMYKLNKDSTVKKDIWYNKFLKKWMAGDTYSYHKGSKLPYMSHDRDNYKCFYTYDTKGQVIGKLLQDDNKASFVEFEYSYDSTGLLVKEVKYSFFDGKREDPNGYTLYEYERNATGNVVKREMYFVPSHTQESITKTDKHGNQKTSYFGFNPKSKSITETVYYNDKGERIRKIEYDREDKPQFIWTYDYEYYQ